MRNLQREAYGEFRELSESDRKYSFTKTKLQLETIDNPVDKIAYLLERKTEYLQDDIFHTLSDGISFDKQCQLEIEKLNQLIKLKRPTSITKSSSVSKYKIRKKLGCKTDLIRILNALYELRLIETLDGQMPQKINFMTDFGNFLGVDLSKYHSDLSQAFNTGKLESNLKIFDEMKQATQKAIIET